jgi:hypothetical protein
MADTIADLGNSDQKKTVIVGRSMLQDSRPWNERITEQLKARQEEMDYLEQGGYDYDGDAPWIAAMRNVGRK